MKVMNCQNLAKKELFFSQVGQGIRTGFNLSDRKIPFFVLPLTFFFYCKRLLGSPVYLHWDRK